MTAISVHTLTQAVLERLQEQVTQAVWFVSEADDVPLVAHGDGRPEPYGVLHPSLGAVDGELDLGDSVDAVSWPIGVTCVAGYDTDLQVLVDDVHAALFRWEMAVPGLVCGPFKPPPGFSAPFLLDRAVTPHRPYVPLQYVSPITAA